MKVNVWSSYKDQYEVTKLENARILQSWFHTNNKTLIDGGAIYTGSITAVQIQAKTITGDKMVARTLTANEILAGTITANEIATRTLTADRIKANVITANEIMANTITAGQIAANTITAGQIAAGTITGDRLKANTITATQIAASSITATEIAIGDFTNMSGISEDRPELGIPIVTLNNKKYLKFGPAAYAQAAFAKSVTREFKIGDKYFLSFSGYKDSAFGANFIVRYFYTDKTWGNAGSVAIPMGTADALVEVTLDITLDADPAKTVDNVLFFVEKDSSTTGQYYMRSIELRKMYTGKLIVNGTITATELAANAVTADKIAANAITSDKIYANAVTTVKIAAEAVTATEIKSYTITAKQILARTITANEIETQTITANEIRAGAITAIKLDVTNIFADTAFVNKIKAVDLVADRITTGTLAAARIAANSLTGDKIQANTLDANRIKAGTLTFDQARGGTLRLGEDGGGDLVVYDGKDPDGNLIPVGAISRKSAEFPVVTSPDIRGNVVNTNTQDTTLYVDNVNGNDNNNGLTKATAFRTVQAAVNSLPKYIARNVEIVMTASGVDQVENVSIKGFIGGAQFTLRSESKTKTLVGGVDVFGCSVFTRIVDFKINSRNPSAIYVDKCVSVVIAGMEINGNNVSYQGINIFNSRAEVIGCAIYNVANDCIKAALAAHVYVGDCKGGGANAQYGLSCIGAVMTGYGSAPTGRTGNYYKTYGGFMQEGSWWWDSGSAPPIIPPVTEQTVFIDSVGAGSWRNNGDPRGWYSSVDAVQGTWNTYGPSYGIWWFGDRLEFLKGKTVIGMWASVKRNAGGWSAADGCSLRSHSYRSRPGDSQPWMSGEFVRTPAMNKDDRIWVDVTSLGRKMADPNGNDRGGLGVQAEGNGSTPFLRMDAWMQLKITYK